jgi:hypothetical protein
MDYTVYWILHNQSTPSIFNQTIKRGERHMYYSPSNSPFKRQGIRDPLNQSPERRRRLGEQPLGAR